MDIIKHLLLRFSRPPDGNYFFYFLFSIYFVVGSLSHYSIKTAQIRATRHVNNILAPVSLPTSPLHLEVICAILLLLIYTFLGVISLGVSGLGLVLLAFLRL